MKMFRWSGVTTFVISFLLVLLLGGSVSFVDAQGPLVIERMWVNWLEVQANGAGLFTTNLITSDDLSLTDDYFTYGNITRSSLGCLMYLNSDYQPETQYVSFDVEEATMDADDGSTGIVIAHIQLAFNCRILEAGVTITQGCGDADDTAALIINNDNDYASPVTVLDAMQDCAAAGLLWYTPTGHATTEIATMTSANDYIICAYLDVGNDGSTSANLQGYLYVKYIRW